MLFRRRQSEPPIAFDKTGKVPVIRSSICTGERVAGFKDETTGHFHEVMLIQSPKDMKEFLRNYQVKESEVKMEW